jgi:hypothetical protein
MTDAETAQAALYWVCGLRLREIAARHGKYGKQSASPICSAITAFILKYHPSPPVNCDGGIRYGWGQIAVRVPPLLPSGMDLYEWKRVEDPVRWAVDPTAAYPKINRKALAVEAISAWCREQPVKPQLRVLLVKRPRTLSAQPAGI